VTAPLLSIKPVQDDRGPARQKHCTAKHIMFKKLVTGRQKPRHASLIPAGKGTLTRCGDTAPASIHSATLTAFIAGPLAFI
jgi:hypothetical protein